MTTMASEQSACRKPSPPICKSLPPEVWINVFHYHTDLAHLWLVCRRVSSTFRACAERAFGEEFLQDVRIDFQLERFNLGGKSQRPEVTVAFERIGRRAGKAIAWYRDSRRPLSQVTGLSQKERDHYQKVTRRWEENVHGRKPEMPNYIITIGCMINDTDLPGLQIDVEKQEISFQWPEMLDLFFREQGRLYKLKASWHATKFEKTAANNAREDKGNQVSPQVHPSSWSKAEMEYRKEIRRTRLKEYFRSDEKMTWAIDSMKYLGSYRDSLSGDQKGWNLLPDIPGTGLGERWFGNNALVEELCLDEWSCMHRINMKIDKFRIK